MDERDFLDRLFWYAGDIFNVKLEQANEFHKSCNKVAWVSIRLFCCYEHAYKNIHALEKEKLGEFFRKADEMHSLYTDGSEASVWMVKLYDQYREVLKVTPYVAWQMMSQTAAKLAMTGQPFLHLNPVVVHPDSPESKALNERYDSEASVH